MSCRIYRAERLKNRCENCGVLFAAGEKSEWFFNEGTWFHSCDSGHVRSAGAVISHLKKVLKGA